MSLKKRAELISIFLFLGILINYSNLGLPKFQLLYLNFTESLPIGFYVAIPTVSYRNGDIVAYDEPDIVTKAAANGWISATDTDVKMLKHIALPGTPYSIGADGVFSINGKYIGLIKQNDGKGHELPQLKPGHYIVPVGSFLPYTHASNSYDGRYTGAVSLENIRHRVIPLITLGKEP